MFTSHENKNVNLIIMQLDSNSYIGTRTQYMHDRVRDLLIYNMLKCLDRATYNNTAE